MVRCEEKKKKTLKDLIDFFVVNMEHGHSFRYYCGTSAHDEDYIEYDIYKIFNMTDNVFTIEWFGFPVGKRNVETVDWEELTDWLDEKWN